MVQQPRAHLQIFLEFEHRAMCYMGLFSEPIHQHELGLLCIKLGFGDASVAVLVMKPKEMLHLKRPITAVVVEKDCV